MVVVLIVLGIAYAAVAIPMMLRFRAYCDRVADRTGRSKDRRDRSTNDDAGTNAFEREQWRSIWNSDFDHLSDPVLAAEGAALSRKFKLSLALALCLIATVAVIDLWLR